MNSAPTQQDIFTAHDVAVATGESSYRGVPPFHPPEHYPEYPFTGPEAMGDNAAYQTVRDALQLLQLDEARLNTANWNPLGGCIRPGDMVVLKPNFVRDFRESSSDHADCLITHGAVIRAMVDYVYLALKGRGRIIIADAPQNDADFDAIRRITQIDAIAAFYRQNADLEIEIYDLRPERADKVDGVIVGHVRLPGDPAGYVPVNLGPHSAFREIEPLCGLLYGSEYDRSELVRHHQDGRHEYLISRTILEADCVIGIPKLKTHKKVGLTVNLKNLVGINGNKNWLPHHREGTPRENGDQFPKDSLKSRVERRTVAGFKRAFPFLGPLRPVVAGPIKTFGRRLFGDTNVDTIRSGNWYGNDTTWRMVLDLNRILLYADKNGRLHDQPVRRFFSVVDGIVAGEGNGPLDPTPRPTGWILAGMNPVAVDLAAARLMGFDRRRLPLLMHALADHPLPLCRFDGDTVSLRSHEMQYNGTIGSLHSSLPAFQPHFGWVDHIEL